MSCFEKFSKRFIDYFRMEKEGFDFIHDSERVISMVESYFERNSLGSPINNDNWDKILLEIRNIIGVEKMIEYIKQNQVTSGFNIYGAAHYDESKVFKHYTQFSFPNAFHIIFEHFFEQEFGHKPTIVLIEPLSS